MISFSPRPASGARLPAPGRGDPSQWDHQPAAAPAPVLPASTGAGASIS